MGDRHEVAARLGMAAPSDEQHARCRAAADQIMATLAGYTVQEAVSILTLCSGEAIGLLWRHDQPKALRALLPSVAAHVAAQPQGRHRWSDHIRPEDVAL